MRYDRSRGRNGPRVLLADDPTGNLDAKTADHVFATLTALVARIWTLPPTRTAASRSRCANERDFEPPQICWLDSFSFLKILFQKT